TDLGGQTPRGLPPDRRQPPGDGFQLLPGRGLRLLQLAPLQPAALDQVELLAGAATGLDHIGQRWPVLGLESEDQVLATPDLVEAGRVVLDRRRVFSHAPTELLG